MFHTPVFCTEYTSEQRPMTCQRKYHGISGKNSNSQPPHEISLLPSSFYLLLLPSSSLQALGRFENQRPRYSVGQMRDKKLPSCRATATLCRCARSRLVQSGWELVRITNHHGRVTCAWLMSAMPNLVHRGEKSGSFARLARRKMTISSRPEGGFDIPYRDMVGNTRLH